ncbi:MAG: hypothetical protein FWE35_15285 [Streptosporangiales bacterium]|nr:hypothetical protein [Streptosporangiales bacterium]
MTSITVLAEEGPVTLGFDDLVLYHGHAALAMLALTFRAQEAAFRCLLGDTPPARAAIAVRSGHPGPGVRDAFEMVTRCVTRGAYTVDRSLPGPRLNPRADVVYAFEITIADVGSQHIAVREGVLPEEFIRLVSTTKNEEQNARFSEIKREIATAALAEPNPENLFLLSPVTPPVNPA